MTKKTRGMGGGNWGTVLAASAKTARIETREELRGTTALFPCGLSADRRTRKRNSALLQKKRKRAFSPVNGKEPEEKMVCNLSSFYYFQTRSVENR